MRNYEGFFKIWRKLFLNPIWLKSKPEHKVILLALLANAQWRSNAWEWNGRPYQCKAGEFISSYGNIAKDCGKGITVQMVRDAFIRFKKLDFLTWDAGKSRTDGVKVTILNWCNYQNDDDEI